jgi:hypothetical protein
MISVPCHTLAKRKLGAQAFRCLNEYDFQLDATRIHMRRVIALAISSAVTGRERSMWWNSILDQESACMRLEVTLL